METTPVYEAPSSLPFKFKFILEWIFWEKQLDSNETLNDVDF